MVEPYVLYRGVSYIYEVFRCESSESGYRCVCIYCHKHGPDAPARQDAINGWDERAEMMAGTVLK